MKSLLSVLVASALLTSPFAAWTAPIDGPEKRKKQGQGGGKKAQKKGQGRKGGVNKEPKTPGNGRFNAGAVNSLDEYAPSRSDKSEMEALASKGFTWLTGSPADNDVSAVGKSAQYFGFVSLRYSSGRAASRGGSAREFYDVLSPQQRQLVLDLVKQQQPSLDAYAEARKKILRQLETILYTGQELDDEFILALGEEYGRHDTAVTLLQARTYGKINAGLSPAQRNALRALRTRINDGESLEQKPGGGKQGGRRGQKGPLSSDARGFSKEQRHELINVCGKGFTWLTGTPKDNESLPLGKPGMFFGFISLRQKSGQSVSRGGIAWDFHNTLNAAQQTVLHDTVKQQHPVVDAYLAQRITFLRHLETILKGAAVDVDLLMKQGIELGRLDVKVGIIQARAYARIRDGLNEKQMTELMDLRARNSIDSESLANLSVEERGERLAFLCTSCHSRDPGEIKAGPSLHGIFGRSAASQNPYPYSPALQSAAANGLTWTQENLEQFLASPKSMVPGTSMTFKGFLHEADRKAVVQFMRDAYR